MGYGIKKCMCIIASASPIAPKFIEKIITMFGARSTAVPQYWEHEEYCVERRGVCVEEVC